jgi:hypothetical protein
MTAKGMLAEKDPGSTVVSKRPTVNGEAIDTDEESIIGLSRFYDWG